MAVTVSKLSQADSVSTRKHRVARISAKAGRRPKATEPPPEPIEPELELEGEAEPEDKPEDKKAARGDAGTYLSMYFRDMATLDVLRPEEEFTSAREIEALEMILWETSLGFPAALAYVCDVVDAELPGVSEVRTLRKAGGDLSKKGGSTRFGKAVKKAARELRERDADKLFADAVVAAVERLVRGTPVRGIAPDRRIARARGFADWARRVAAADRAVADARNDFVKAN